jgi:4-amino-4-deoxy-L-arabinose transferase-like glycosyltransferase
VSFRPSSNWGGPRVALGALLALAAALRLTGIQYGLPYGNLLDPDEQSIVPRAWAMTHGAGADPGWFDYPSLLFYVLAPFEWLADAPSYLVARLVVVAFALGAVAATWWLGRAAYGSVAAVVGAAAVAVDSTHVDYSRAAVTDVPLTLAVAVALALLVRGRLELAAVAVGVAMGFKYPGVFLLVPLAVAAWGQWRRLAVSLALAALTFAATSPFLFVHLGDAIDDASRVQERAREGWLGFEHDHVAPLAYLDRLWEGIGPFLLVALAGLAAAAVRRSRADLVLGSFVVVYFLDLLTIGAHFDRYVLPLVPPLAVLAGRFRALAPVALVLLVVPLTWSVRDAVERTRTDTRVVAARWIERHVPAGATLTVDPSTPDVGRPVQRLELPAPWAEPDPRRDVARLRGYVVVTGAVADRVLAARDRYPREARFYDQLERTGRRLFYVQSGDHLAGPWVAIYKL